MKIFAAILFIISPFLMENVSACSCSSIAAIYDSYNGAEAVFIGKVIDSKDLEAEEILNTGEGKEIKFEGKERIFNFEVKEVFKGIKKKSEKQMSL